MSQFLTHAFERELSRNDAQLFSRETTQNCIHEMRRVIILHLVVNALNIKGSLG